MRCLTMEGNILVAKYLVQIQTQLQINNLYVNCIHIIVFSFKNLKIYICKLTNYMLVSFSKY